MSMFIAEQNFILPFSDLDFDINDGELIMMYSYVVADLKKFDKEALLVYFADIVRKSMEMYTKLSQIAVGKLTKEEKGFYKKVFESALDAINEENEDDISYGIEKIREQINSTKLTPDFAGSEYDDEYYDSEYKTTTPSLNTQEHVYEELDAEEDTLKMFETKKRKDEIEVSGGIDDEE